MWRYYTTALALRHTAILCIPNTRVGIITTILISDSSKGGSPFESLPWALVALLLPERRDVYRASPFGRSTSLNNGPQRLAPVPFSTVKDDPDTKMQVSAFHFSSSQPIQATHFSFLPRGSRSGLHPGRKHTYPVCSCLDYPVRHEQGTRAPAPPAHLVPFHKTNLDYFRLLVESA
jgi:hypothetical protein